MNEEQLREALRTAQDAVARATAALDQDRSADNLTAAASRFLRERRERDEIFPSGLLVEPEWDMLLVLAKAHGERSGLRQVDLLNAVPAPPTTVTRVIQRLEAAGLIRQVKDERVGKRSRIHLTAAGLRRMKRALLGVDAE